MQALDHLILMFKLLLARRFSLLYLGRYVDFDENATKPKIFEGISLLNQYRAN